DGDRQGEAAERLVQRDPRVPEEAITPVPPFGKDRGRRGHDEPRNAKGVGGGFPHEERADERRRRHDVVSDGAPVHHRAAPRLAKIRPRTSSLAALKRGSNSSSIVRGRGRSTASTRAIRPGRGVITTTRSASRMASGIEWVTNRMV